ncbi:MAG: hypothetical protein AAF990_07555 [Bacteroidota bacterium]
MASTFSPPLFLLPNNRKVLLPLLLVGTALLLLLNYQNSFYLMDCVALNGMESLKFSGGTAYVLDVLNSWSMRGQIEVARWNTFLDLPFIVIYVLLFSYWMVQVEQFYRKRLHFKTAFIAGGLSWLIFLAGIFDVWENTGILQWLTLHQVETNTLEPFFLWHPKAIAFVAFFKLAIILACTITSLLWFCARYALLFDTLWRCRVSLIICGLIYFVFWKTAQGRDLLISINEQPLHVIFLVIIATILASFCWFIPRYYFKDNLDNLPSEKNISLISPVWSTHYQSEASNPYPVILPRLLGVLSILILYGAIRDVLRTCDCYYIEKGVFIPPLVQLLGIFAFFAILTRWNGRNFLQTLHPKWQHRLLKIALGLVGILLIILGFLQFFEPAAILDKPKGLDILSYGLLLLSTSFFIFVTIRRKLNRLDMTMDLGRYLSDNRVVSWAMFTAIGMCALVLICANVFSVEISRFVGGASMTFIAILSYLSLFSFLSIRRRGTRAHLLTTFFLLAGTAIFVTSSMDNNYHDIDATPLSCKDCRPLSLEDYFQQWVAARQSDILQRDSFPIFIVSSNGGGSRAAYWTALINARLSEATQGRYERHLFALSGASGGSIGSSVFVSMLYNRQQDQQAAGRSLVQQVDTLFKGADFLSPALTYLVGKGTWQCFIPGDLSGLIDRSEQLRLDYQSRLFDYAGVDRSIFDTPFRDLWYNDNYSQINPELPLYFANTTRVEGGRRAIGCPVQIDAAFVDALDVLDLGNGQSLSYGNASFLTNRFPIIDAAGKIGEKGHFVDAGYFDNTGAVTAVEVIDRLQDWTKQQSTSADSSLYNRLRFYLIKIDNDEYTSGIIAMEQLGVDCTHLNEIPELLTPLNAGLGALLTGHVSYADHRIRRSTLNKRYFHFWLPYPVNDKFLSAFCACSSVYPCRENEECLQWNEQFPKPESCFGLPPLGRYLSAHAIERMKLQLDSFEELQNNSFLPVVSLVNQSQ